MALSNPQRALLRELQHGRAKVPGTRAMTARALDKAGLVKFIGVHATITDLGKQALQYKRRKAVCDE